MVAVVLAEYYIRMDSAGVGHRDYKAVNHRRLMGVVVIRCMALPVRLEHMVTRQNHNYTKMLVCHISDIPSLLEVAAFHKSYNS